MATHTLGQGHSSPAARFNHSVLAKLSKAFDEDPEANLLDAFPTGYAARLAARKVAASDIRRDGNEAPVSAELTQTDTTPSEPGEPVQDLPFTSVTQITVVSPLSDAVRALLGRVGWSETESCSALNLAKALLKVIQTGELLWPPSHCKGIARKVIKCSEELVLKINLNDDLHVEHGSMQYLEYHKPDFPAPRAHGLVVMGPWRLCFMSFVPGVTLSSIWSGLNELEKHSVSEQLDTLFLDLRQLPFTAGSCLGAVSTQVCIDARRELRITKEPIKTVDEFDDFRFSDPIFGSSSYLKFLRRISNSAQPRSVKFSHGDVRTENIIVLKKDNGVWVVNGIIDWEMSGFYPEDFESTKITNTMSPTEDDDWFLFLPLCISPARYPARWLLDRLWAKHVQ